MVFTEDVAGEIDRRRPLAREIIKAKLPSYRLVTGRRMRHLTIFERGIEAMLMSLILQNRSKYKHPRGRRGVARAFFHVRGPPPPPSRADPTSGKSTARRLEIRPFLSGSLEGPEASRPLFFDDPRGIDPQAAG